MREPVAGEDYPVDPEEDAVAPEEVAEAVERVVQAPTTKATAEEVAEAVAEAADELMDAPAEEEEDGEQGFPMPPVEIILHNAVTQIAHVPTPNGTMTLARFVTPAFVFTLKLDERGKKGLIMELLDEGSDIVVPKPGIILPGQ